MLRDGFLRFCDNPEISCCKAERELENLRSENASLHARLAASQRREKAAVEEVCRRCPDGDVIDGLKHYSCDRCKWRGPKRLEVEL
jgi:hypothetical protein